MTRFPATGRRAAALLALTVGLSAAWAAPVFAQRREGWLNPWRGRVPGPAVSRGRGAQSVAGLGFRLGWANDTHFRGLPFAAAADDAYKVAGWVRYMDSLELGGEATVLGANYRFVSPMNNLYTAASFPIGGGRGGQPGRMRLGYRELEFPVPSGGSTVGFRGIRELQEAFLEARAGQWVVEHVRSLEKGDDGGSWSRLGLTLGLPGGQGPILTVSANYNDRYFRQEKGLTHYEFLAESPMVLGSPPGTLTIRPYADYLRPRDGQFEQQFLWGVDIQFDF